jgi:hypothetical protein
MKRRWKTKMGGYLCLLKRNCGDRIEGKKDDGFNQCNMTDISVCL